MTFEGLDWSLGTAAVTVHLEDLALHSVVGIDGSEEEITVGLYLVDPAADWVTISGTASNMTDTTHRVDMNASCGFTSHNDVGPDWSMRVEPGVDFTMRVVELDPITDEPPRVTSQDFINWVLIEHEAVTADTTVDIDFSTAVTPSSVSNSITMPTFRSDSPLMGTTYSYAITYAGRLAVGFPELCEPNTDVTAFDENPAECALLRSSTIHVRDTL